MTAHHRSAPVAAVDVRAASVRDAVIEGQKLLAAAIVEAERVIDEAKAEARALLQNLPDFAAIEAVPAPLGRSAYQVIRDAADRRGIAIAAVTGTSTNPLAKAARYEAVLGVLAACPDISGEQAGKLFKRTAKTFSSLKALALQARRRGEI
jgi:ABC-type sugar transport system substrate-binding protein